jgi:hypothetical protein
MNPLKEKQVKLLNLIGCKDLADKVNEIVNYLNEENLDKEKLEFEDHNFRIDSTGWKKKTEDGQDYLENPEGDVWELVNCEDPKLNGEQLFTWEAMMRETKGKRVPTDEEFDELPKDKEDMPNLVFAGRRDTDGSFDYLSSYASFWSSSVFGPNAWRRTLYSSGSTVYRYASNQTRGFSVRCLKDN